MSCWCIGDITHADSEPKRALSLQSSQKEIKKKAVIVLIEEASENKETLGKNTKILYSNVNTPSESHKKNSQASQPNKPESEKTTKHTPIGLKAISEEDHKEFPSKSEEEVRKDPSELSIQKVEVESIPDLGNLSFSGLPIFLNGSKESFPFTPQNKVIGGGSFQEEKKEEMDSLGLPPRNGPNHHKICKSISQVNEKPKKIGQKNQNDQALNSLRSYRPEKHENLIQKEFSISFGANHPSQFLFESQKNFKTSPEYSHQSTPAFNPFVDPANSQGILKLQNEFEPDFQRNEA